MSLRSWFETRHPGMGSSIARVVFYSVAMLLSMHMSASYFGDTYRAAASMFAVLSASFELLWHTRAHSGARYWLFLACLAGLVFSGTILIQEATAVQAMASASKF